MASAEAPERVRHLLADSESTAEENQVLHEKKKKKASQPSTNSHSRMLRQVRLSAWSAYLSNHVMCYGVRQRAGTQLRRLTECDGTGSKRRQRIFAAWISRLASQKKKITSHEPVEPPTSHRYPSRNFEAGASATQSIGNASLPIWRTSGPALLKLASSSGHCPPPTKDSPLLRSVLFFFFFFFFLSLRARDLRLSGCVRVLFWRWPFWDGQGGWDKERAGSNARRRDKRGGGKKSFCHPTPILTQADKLRE